MEYPQETQERDRVSELKNERISLQKKTFTKWVNAFLEGSSVTDIFTDLSDGKLLIKLVENISGGKFGDALKGKQRIHKIENVSRVLEFLKKSVKLESIGPEDVVDGKEELILGLLWTMILRFSISEVQEESGDGKSVKESLLIWCQRKTKGYAGVDIKNFTTSWKSGLAFNALIHTHRSDLFEYSSLQGNHHFKNLEHAFNVAEEKLGIKKLLDPQDIDVARPDEKSIMTYVGLMYQYFAKRNKEKTGEKRLNKFVAELAELDKLKNTYIEMTTDILRWINMKAKELQNELPTDQHALHKEFEHFKRFRNVDKPKKSAECVNVEVLLFNIRSQLQVHKYKSFMPPVGMTVSDLHKAWKQMEVAENERDKAIRNERLRHERISQLLKKFQQKVKLREGWLTERMNILDSEQAIHDLQHVDTITRNLKRQQAFEAEVKAQEVRFGNLDKIVEELKIQEYGNVKNVENRIEQIKEFWKKVVKKVSARKKTLTSLQNIATLIQRMDELKVSLDLLKQVSFQYKLAATTNLIDMDSFIQENAHNMLQLENKKIECDAIKSKVDTLVRAKHQHSTMMSSKMKNITVLFEDLFKAGDEQKRLLNTTKTMLTFKERLEEQFTMLKEKKQLAMINETVTDLVMGNKQIAKHQQSISEVQNCESQYNTLSNEWTELSSLHLNLDLNQPTTEADACQSLVFQMKEELELVKERTNMKSQKLLMSSLQTQMNSSISDVEDWINEKLTHISTMMDPKDVNITELYLKKIYEVRSEIGAFETEMKMLRDQCEDVQEFFRNPDQLFQMRAVVKINHKESGGEKFYKGEIIFIRAQNDNLWKITKRSCNKEYKLKLVFYQDSTTTNNNNRPADEKLMVSPIKNKLTLLETLKPYDKYITSNHGNNQSAEQSTEGFKACEESFKNLKCNCEGSLENLTKMRDFYLLAETANEFIDWGENTLKYINDILKNLGNTDTDTIQRQLIKVDKELDAHKIIYENTQNKCVQLIGQKSPKEKELTEMKHNLGRLMDSILPKRSFLNERYMAAHGAKLFQHETNKLFSWIAEKMKDVSRDIDFSNLNIARRAHKNIQTTKAEIDSIEHCIEQLGDDQLLKNSNHPESQELYNNLTEQLNTLKNTTDYFLENVSASYGIQGFLADSEEVLISCKDKELLLNRPIQTESLEDIETFNHLLDKMDGELSGLVKDMQDLIVHAGSVKDNGQHQVSRAVCALKDSLRSIQDLWGTKKEEVQRQKFALHVEKTLECCKKDTLELNNLMDDLDTAKDELTISSTALTKECEKLRSRLNINKSKVAKAASGIADSSVSGIPGKHVQSSLSVFTPLVNSVETLLQTSATKLETLEKEAVELATYELFVEESKQLGDWIQEKLPSVTPTLNNVPISIQTISDQWKEHENLQMEIVSQESLKRKLDEKASLYLEDCHFASSEISDLLDEMDTRWLEFNERCKQKEEFLKKASRKEKLESSLLDVKDWTNRSRRKLLVEPHSETLSGSRKLLKDHEQFEVNLANRLLEGEKLLKDAVDQNDQSVIVMATKVLDSIKEINQFSKEKLVSFKNENNMQQFLIQTHMEQLWVEEQLTFLDSMPQNSENLTQALSIDRSLELSALKLDHHQQCFDSAVKYGMQCLNNDPKNHERIDSRIQELQTSWTLLNTKLDQQRKHQKHRIDVLQYLTDASQHITMLEQKLAIALSKNDYGKDLSSSEIALKRHAQFSSELSQYKATLKRFVKMGNTISGVEVKTAANDIKSKFKKLEKCCDSRQKMLQSSHDLFLLYFEVENFKVLVQDLNTIVSDDNYGKNYEEVLQLNQSFESVLPKVEFLVEPLSRLTNLSENLVSQNHPHTENIEKLQTKVVNMNKRVRTKCEQRHKKLQKSLKYQHFLFNISSFVSTFDELNMKLQKYGERLEQFETVPALKEELRQLNLFINESKSFREQLGNLAVELQDIAKDHPGKNIQKLAEHLQALQNNYQTSVQKSEEIAEKYTLKILMRTFDTDVHHLQNWYKQTKHDLTEMVTADKASVQNSMVQIQLKKKQIELKETKIEELQQNVNSLDIPGEKKKIMQRTLSDLIEVKGEIRSQCKSLLVASQSKLNHLSFSREVQNVFTALDLIDKSLESHKGTISDKPRPDICRISRRHTELKNLFAVQKHRMEQVTLNLKSIDPPNVDVEDDVVDKSCCEDILEKLHLKEKNVAEKLMKRSNDIERMVALQDFLEHYNELNVWVEETVVSLSKQSTEENIKFLEKQHRKLQTDITVYQKDFKKLQELTQSLITDDNNNNIIHVKVKELTTKWDTLIELNEKRRENIAEKKALCEFKKNIDLIKLYIRDQVTILQSKDCNVQSIDDGSNLLRSLSGIEKEIEKIGKHVQCIGKEGIELLSRLPYLKEEAAFLQKTLQSDFQQVQAIVETMKGSINQSVYTQQFCDVYEEIEAKAKEMEKQLSEMTFNSDSDPRKGAGVMYKDFSTIEKNIELLKTRKETLREMSRLLRNINTSREDCDDKLLVLEQNFANLVEKAKKKKLLVEAQNRLHGFLQDVERTAGWTSETLRSIQNNKPMHCEVDGVSRLLQKNAELRFEIESKVMVLPQLNERGHSLIQDGQLSAMEVESRLKDLQNGFVAVNDALALNEKELCESVSYQKYDDQMKEMLDWLKENHVKLNALHLKLQQQQQQQQQQQHHLQQYSYKNNLKLTSVQLNIIKDSLQRLEKNFQECNFFNEYLTSVDVVGERKSDHSLREKVKREIEVVRNEIVDIEDQLDTSLQVSLLIQDASVFQQWIAEKEEHLQNILQINEKDVFTQSRQFAYFENEIKTMQRTLDCYKPRYDKLDLKPLNNRRISPSWKELRKNYEDFCQKSAETKQIISCKSENDGLTKELDRIEKLLIEKKQSILDVCFTEDRNLLEKMVQRLEDTGESISTMEERFNEVIGSIGVKVTEENTKKIQEISERFTAAQKLHQKKDSFTTDVFLFLSLCNEMNEEIAWLNTKRRHVVESQSFGEDISECDSIVREIKHTMDELAKHKSVSSTICGKLEHLTNKTDDELFLKKLEDEMQSFNTLVYQFEKEIGVRLKMVLDALSIHEFLDDCDHLHTQYEDLCELSQDITTGNNKETATKLLQRNKHHQELLSGYNDHFTVLQSRLEDYINCLSCFESLEHATTEKMDLLRKIRDEAISLTQMRQLTLESSVQFYRFKSELLFLDQWIQEQIAHIKTDGIGNCTVDCRALLKETEDFAKNLIAKEERIANFGILSQEITERHPASAKQILKNTSNIYEMWNDVKELLQSRLEVLELASGVHAFNENVTDLVHWIERVNTDLGTVQFDDIDGTDHGRKKLNKFKREHEDINESYKTIMREKSTALRKLEKDDACSKLIVPFLEKLEKVFESLTNVMESSSQTLEKTVERKEFLVMSSQFGKWLDDTISIAQTYLQETREHKLDTSSHQQKISMERDSYENLYLKLSSRLADVLEMINENVKSDTLQVWRSIELNWNLLTQLLSEWHYTLLEMQGVSKAMEELGLIEEWIKTQEKIFLSEENSIFEASDVELEEVLNRHKELDEYFPLQDEKVRLACLKVDSGDRNSKRKESNSNSSIETGLNFATRETLTVSKELTSKEEKEEEKQHWQQQQHQQNHNHQQQQQLGFERTKTKDFDKTESSKSIHTAHLIQGRTNGNIEGEKNHFEQLNLQSLDSAQNKTPHVEKSSSKTLVGLLKKKKSSNVNLREPKKRVIFNTTHEFSDGCGNIENFYQLNDEIDGYDVGVDDDLLYENDGDESLLEEDGDESFLEDGDSLMDENNNSDLFMSDDDGEADGVFEFDTCHDPADFPSPPNQFMAFKGEVKDDDETNDDDFSTNFWSKSTASMQPPIYPSDINDDTGNHDDDVCFTDSDNEEEAI